jgi:hypothetical protein
LVARLADVREHFGGPLPVRADGFGARLSSAGKPNVTAVSDGGKDADAAVAAAVYGLKNHVGLS